MHLSRLPLYGLNPLRQAVGIAAAEGHLLNWFQVYEVAGW